MAFINSLHNKKIYFFVLLITFVCYSFLFAGDYNITQCNPNKLFQGDDNVSITLMTNYPLPQNSNDEFTYSSIYFSNSAIHVKDVTFRNQFTMTCSIDIDRDANILDGADSVDVDIVSYDKDGIPYNFSGKGIFKILRKPYIDEILVNNASQPIIYKNESAKLTFNGTNFTTDSVGILIAWSGLPMLDAEVLSSNSCILNLSADDTNKIPAGEYDVYLYNSDDSNNKASIKLKVESR